MYRCFIIVSLKRNEKFATKSIKILQFKNYVLWFPFRSLTFIKSTRAVYKIRKVWPYLAGRDYFYQTKQTRYFEFQHRRDRIPNNKPCRETGPSGTSAPHSRGMPHTQQKGVLFAEFFLFSVVIWIKHLKTTQSAQNFWSILGRKEKFWIKRPKTAQKSEKSIRFDSSSGPGPSSIVPPRDTWQKTRKSP